MTLHAEWRWIDLRRDSQALLNIRLLILACKISFWNIWWQCGEVVTPKNVVCFRFGKCCSVLRCLCTALPPRHHTPLKECLMLRLCIFLLAPCSATVLFAANANSELICCTSSSTIWIFRAWFPLFFLFFPQHASDRNNESLNGFNWTHGNSSSQSINFGAAHTRYLHLGVDSIRRENAVRSEAKASLTVSVTFQSRCCEVFEKQIWRCIRVATGKSMRQIL